MSGLEFGRPAARFAIVIAQTRQRRAEHIHDILDLDSTVVRIFADGLGLIELATFTADVLRGGCGGCGRVGADEAVPAIQSHVNREDRCCNDYEADHDTLGDETTLVALV